MSELLIQENTLTDIADAIRLKTGTTEEIPLTEFVERIESIKGGDVTDISNSIFTTYTSPYSVSTSNGCRVNGYIIDNFTDAKNSIYTGHVIEDMEKDWEIGVMFSIDTIGDKSQVLFGAYDNYYNGPTLEIQSSGNLWCGYTTSSTSWTSGLLIEDYTIELNTWYFVKYNYSATDSKVTISITTDFLEFQDYELEVTGAQYSTYDVSSSICFGGIAKSSNHMLKYGMIDTRDTYIKEEGEITWGSYSHDPDTKSGLSATELYMALDNLYSLNVATSVVDGRIPDYYRGFMLSENIGDTSVGAYLTIKNIRGIKMLFINCGSSASYPYGSGVVVSENSVLDRDFTLTDGTSSGYSGYRTKEFTTPKNHKCTFYYSDYCNSGTSGYPKYTINGETYNTQSTVGLNMVSLFLPRISTATLIRLGIIADYLIFGER